MVVRRMGKILIDSYHFGRMVVNGEQYTSDLIVFPNRVLGGWWRRVGHQLCIEDIKEIIDERPEVLVVGTGYSGLMRVLPETKQLLEAKGITLIAEKTSDAYKTHNDLSKTRKVIGAFHLTC